MVAEPGCWLLACWYLLPAARGSGAWLLEVLEKSRSSEVMPSAKNTYVRADVQVHVE
jgi:hypothetical protein